jgi:peptidyl-prolyl cis-trans isomerase D
MKPIRELAKNLFFKIILAVVALSFILFGVSGFILEDKGSWVAKVGNHKISYKAFENNLKTDRAIILGSSENNPDLQNYLESDRFKSDSLGQMIRKIMIEKTSEDFGAKVSRKLILQKVAENKAFRDENDKFDNEKFKNFLAQKGFDEEKYVKEVANELSANIVIQSLTMSAPIDYDFAIELEKFNQQKRVADIVSITTKNLPIYEKITDQEIEKFYNDNKQSYTVPELRKVSYVKISTADFNNKFEITDSEIKNEYENNKEKYSSPELRDIYHVVFEKKEQAEEFIQKFKASEDKTKAQQNFANLAKELAKKNLKEITLNKTSQSQLTSELSIPVFQLLTNEVSNPIQSSLGYHVVLLNKIYQSALKPLEQVQKEIFTKISNEKKEKFVEQKINEINDTFLTSNSLSDALKKLNLKSSINSLTIDSSGRNDKGQTIFEILNLNNFSENAFLLKENQISKLTSLSSNEFYTIQLEKILPSRIRNLDEVKDQLKAIIQDKKNMTALNDLVKKINEELKSSSIESIISKYQLKVQRNQILPRNIVNSENEYVKNKLLDELFALKEIGKFTSTVPTRNNEFFIAILKDIKKSSFNQDEILSVKKKIVDGFFNDIIKEYSNYLQKKYPVKVNEKIFGQTK